MDKKNFGCYPKKDLYIPSYEQWFMNWHTRIANEWKNAGIIERASWFIQFGSVLVAVVLWMSGYVPKPDDFIITTVVFFILSLVVIFLNISMRHQRDKAQNDFISSKEAISSLLNFIIEDLNEFPYEDGRTFEREIKFGLRAAVAKNGKIPRDSNAIITKLNERDINLGKRFADLERELSEKGLID